MKKNLLTTGLVLAAIIGVCLLRPAQSQEHKLHGLPAAAVIFSAEENYVNGEPSGYTVYNSQSSPNAPKLEPGSKLADDLEYLLAQGFQIQNSDGFVFRMIRPAHTLVME